MPFAMTHLCIAYNIINNTPQIKKPCDFMLGALAPDSIHYRGNYNSDMKKKSHLTVGDEKWGRITNNWEWLENVLAFLQENEHGDNKDFMYGYCSHIIADIQNNIKIWMPFMFENIESLNKGGGSIYHAESNDVDYVLYLLNPQRKVIWEMLENAKGYSIPNIVFEDETEKMKHDTLHNRFSDRALPNVSSNRYVTLSIMQEFISSESEHIKNLLYKNE